MVGFLPPSSSTHGVKFLAAAWWTILPTWGLPVKKMKSHFCARRAVVSGTAPSTTETTRGSKYFGVNLAATVEQATASSDGFSTAVLPAASAAASGWNNSMNGSFQAPIISATPNGSRRTRT